MHTRPYRGPGDGAGASGHDGAGARAVGAKGLYGPFAFSYVIGALLLASLVHWGGFWDILANTRLLAILIDGGIVPLTDMDVGYGLGIPELRYYIASQDDVDWGLLLICVALFLLLAVVKAVQFHRVTQSVGLQASVGSSFRTYVYGHGLNRMLPFEIGSEAAAAALEAQGASAEQARRAVYLQRLFLVFEIVFFALVGLYYVGLFSWITQLFWPVVILLGAYFLARPTRPGVGARATVMSALRAFRGLTTTPIALAELALLSIAAFLVVDTAAYFVAQAFTGDIVLLNATGAQILMALVAGYVARLVPVTPGGIGQFEWGFAASLFVSGMEPGGAAAIALLVSALRYLTGGAVFLVVLLAYGVETDLRRVLARVGGVETRPTEAA